jgi:hypothetical protein
LRGYIPGDCSRFGSKREMLVNEGKTLFNPLEYFPMHLALSGILVFTSVHFMHGHEMAFKFTFPANS